MVRGFLMIPRRLAEAVMNEGAEAFFLWFELWRRAAWREHVAQTSQYGAISLRRGQLILSVNATAEELKIDRAKVRRCIERWKRNGWITRERLPIRRPTSTSTNLPSLITIVDYDNYDTSREDVDQPLGQPAANERIGSDPERKREVRKTNKKKVSERQHAETAAPKAATESHEPSLQRKPISEGQFLYQASRVAKWQEKNADVFVGGDGESYARAFQRDLGMTTDYWRDLQRQFPGISGAAALG